MRHVKRMNPEKRCLIQYDKLYIDGKMFVYNDFKAIVEEQNMPPTMTLQEANNRQEDLHNYGDLFSQKGFVKSKKLTYLQFFQPIIQLEK